MTILPFLHTAIGEFLESDNNRKGVNEADGLLDRFADIAEAGFAMNYRLGMPYMQYRRHEDASRDACRGCVDVTRSAMPIRKADIDQVTVRYSNGNTVFHASKRRGCLDRFLLFLLVCGRQVQHPWALYRKRRLDAV